MINATQMMIDAVAERLTTTHATLFGRQHPEHIDAILWVARMTLEQIADSDALYHDVEHTVMVTLVGQEMLYGRRIIDGGVGPLEWLNTMAALLCHDTGYVRGICNGDTRDSYVVDGGGKTVTLAAGASDAALTGCHVDRSKLFVAENLTDLGLFDIERVQAGVERTRFPVPDSADAQATKDLPGLVRAADLVGQLADPNYLRKINRLFHEFQETGMNAKLGYRTAADLAEGYPRFYWNAARKYIAEGLAYLQVTQRGKQWIANLTSHIFTLEHDEFRRGPQRIPRGGR